VGVVEQEIMELAESGGAGFYDGMIDSMIARQIVAIQTGRKLSPEAFIKALKRCGYLRHPLLDNRQGKLRINPQRVARVWVHKDHPIALCTDAEALKRALV
jgi:hypothetical protein